jgi:hypothetical protein
MVQVRFATAPALRDRECAVMNRIFDFYTVRSVAICFSASATPSFSSALT